MLNPVRKLTLVLMSFMVSHTMYAQDAKIYPDHVYDDKIKSVLLYNSDAVLSEPIIGVGGSVLHLGFDDMTGDMRSLYYTFVHCESDWSESDLNPYDYLSGMTEDKFTNYHTSFNTQQLYVHYSLNLPTSSVQLTKNGNYALLVYEEDKRDQPLFIKHFMVMQQTAQIKARWDRTDQVKYSQTHQAVLFSVDMKNLYMSNPFQEVKVVVQQNDRRDNMITNLQPQFVNGSVLDYNYSEGNIFPGGREFRSFDTRSIRIKQFHVNVITTDNNRNDVYLYPDDITTYSQYGANPDADGKYFIGFLDNGNASTEADYATVHFTLNTSAPFPDGNVYIFGALTNWEKLPEALMTYSPADNAYTGQLVLKQGYYDYQYVFAAKDGTLSNTETEGNSFETENTYQIYVYYHPIGARYDQLVGYTSVKAFSAK